jgi:hypothetical protein
LLYAIYGNRCVFIPIFSVETSFYHPVNEESTKSHFHNLKRIIIHPCPRKRVLYGKAVSGMPCRRIAQRSEGEGIQRLAGDEMYF